MSNNIDLFELFILKNHVSKGKNFIFDNAYKKGFNDLSIVLIIRILFFASKYFFPNEGPNHY